jgi:T4 RnlA family RNA ligase
MHGLIETLEHVLDFSDVETIMDKRDGSMIHPVPTIDGKSYEMKSKKSFESDVAIAAQLHAHANQAIDAFTLYCVQNDLTPTYEFTSPRHRIVLNYKWDDMKLLHIRHNITGKYFTRKEIYDLIASNVWHSPQIKGCIARGSSWRTIEVVDIIEKSYQEIRNSLDSMTDIEGYIIMFKSGEIVKLKTPWYLSLHHNVTFTNQRQVAEMVLNETIDDYKSYLSMVGASQDVVISIENRVIHALDSIERHVISMYDHLKEQYGDDRKQWAMAANKHEYFKLIMDKFSGKEVDYKAFYLKNFLKDDFTLEQV